MLLLFLNNIDALNLAGAIDRSVGKSDGLLSAYATVSGNWSDLTKQDLATNKTEVPVCREAFIHVYR
jgi:hypothetical protein